MAAPRWFFVTAIVGLALAEPAAAQRYQVLPNRNIPRARAPKLATEAKTEIVLEILTGPEGAGLPAQTWREVFDELGHTVHMRQGTAGDTIETREKQIGRIRQVTVVGELDGRGTLHFANAKFTRDESKQLAEWLRELETYGAQGAPNGKPLWGLNATQFKELYAVLKQPVGADISGLTLRKAIDALRFAPAYTVRFNDAAMKRFDIDPARDADVQWELEDVSKGTALSILLHDYDLGFRPSRTPEGAIEISVEPLSDLEVAWPRGWKAPQIPSKLLPHLYQWVPVELDQLPIRDVFAAISAQTKVPILLDRRAIAAADLNLDEVMVTVPPKKTTWSLLLRDIAADSRLQRDVWIDENGKPFIWITTARQALAERERPVIPEFTPQAAAGAQPVE